MFVIAKHQIEDFEGFMQTAGAVVEELPQGTIFHQGIPNTEGTEAICLWECDARESLESFVDDRFRGVSSQEYFEVNEEFAVGVP